jgi:Raf kinase inhibitor-like YbhB/YbcL family protein
LQLEIPTFANGAAMPEEHCFLVRAEEGHVRFGPNRSPPLRWSEVPEGTRSFALIVLDPDSPSVADDMNREDRTTARDLPRTDFHHWVLVDIPANRRDLPAGVKSDGVVVGGKATGRTDYGLRGCNDFTAWFKHHPERAGRYGGYDDPAPPWNDERVHAYHFKLFALGVPRLDLPSAFTARDALDAMQGHVLAIAEHVGLCTLNPGAGSA